MEEKKMMVVDLPRLLKPHSHIKDVLARLEKIPPEFKEKLVQLDKIRDEMQAKRILHDAKMKERNSCKSTYLMNKKRAREQCESSIEELKSKRRATESELDKSIDRCLDDITELVEQEKKEESILIDEYTQSVKSIATEEVFHLLQKSILGGTLANLTTPTNHIEIPISIPKIEPVLPGKIETLVPPNKLPPKPTRPPTPEFRKDIPIGVVDPHGTNCSDAVLNFAQARKEKMMMKKKREINTPPKTSQETELEKIEEKLRALNGTTPKLPTPLIEKPIPKESISDRAAIALNKLKEKSQLEHISVKKKEVKKRSIAPPIKDMAATSEEIQKKAEATEKNLNSQIIDLYEEATKLNILSEEYEVEQQGVVEQVASIPGSSDGLPPLLLGEIISSDKKEEEKEGGGEKETSDTTSDDDIDSEEYEKIVEDVNSSSPCSSEYSVSSDDESIDLIDKKDFRNHEEAMNWMERCNKKNEEIFESIARGEVSMVDGQPIEKIDSDKPPRQRRTRSKKSISSASKKTRKGGTNKRKKRSSDNKKKPKSKQGKEETPNKEGEEEGSKTDIENKEEEGDKKKKKKKKKRHKTKTSSSKKKRMRSISLAPKVPHLLNKEELKTAISKIMTMITEAASQNKLIRTREILELLEQDPEKLKNIFLFYQGQKMKKEGCSIDDILSTVDMKYMQKLFFPHLNMQEGVIGDVINTEDKVKETLVSEDEIKENSFHLLVKESGSDDFENMETFILDKLREELRTPPINHPLERMANTSKGVKPKFITYASINDSKFSSIDDIPDIGGWKHLNKFYDGRILEHRCYTCFRYVKDQVIICECVCILGHKNTECNCKYGFHTCLESLKRYILLVSPTEDKDCKNQWEQWGLIHRDNFKDLNIVENETNRRIYIEADNEWKGSYLKFSEEFKSYWLKRPHAGPRCAVCGILKPKEAKSSTKNQFTHLKCSFCSRNATGKTTRLVLMEK